MKTWLTFSAFILTYSFGTCQDFSLDKKMIENIPTEFNNFGYSSSIDGNYAAISSIYYNEGKGAVYIYKKQNGKWLFNQIITCPEAACARLGRDVILYKNKLVLAAGNRVAYVYERNNDTWSLKDKLARNTTGSSDFPYDISITDSLIVVSDPRENSNEGSVYIFKETALGYELKQKLYSIDPTYFESFGQSISINKNGIIAIGTTASQHNENVQIFNYVDSTWLFHQKILKPEHPSFSTFGYKVEISNKYLIISDTRYRGYQGTAHIYTNVNGIWIHDKQIVKTNADFDDHLGFSLALCDSTIIIGAPSLGNEIGPYFKGFMMIVERQNGKWVSKVVTNDLLENLDGFGFDVALYKNDLFVGAPFDDDSLYEHSGSVYVYQRDNATGVFTLQTALKNSFSVFPNPSNNNLTVRFSSEPNNKSLSLYNSIGQLVLEQLANSQIITIQVAHLPNGVYHLRYNNQVETVLINH